MNYTDRIRNVCQKGNQMTYKVTSFFTWCFCFAFWTFMVVHYTHMKTPSQYREIASASSQETPWYDASYKF